MDMSKPLAMKTFSVVAVAVLLLAHLAPVAAGMLLCIGDGSDPDCCPKPDESRFEESRQLPNGPDCNCCITVDAVPSTTGTNSLKASLDIAAGSGLMRIVAAHTATRIPQKASGDTGDTRLSSLRTVVLLI
jgi:hypothetical protein